VRFSSN